MISPINKCFKQKRIRKLNKYRKDLKNNNFSLTTKNPTNQPKTNIICLQKLKQLEIYPIPITIQKEDKLCIIGEINIFHLKASSLYKFIKSTQNSERPAQTNELIENANNFNK